MKTLHEINCEVFKLIKEKQSVHSSELYDLVKDANPSDVDESRQALVLNYGLATKGRNLKLTEKGLKYDSFESYLESLNKTPMTSFEKWSLLFITITFLFSVFQFFQSKHSDSDLNNQLDSLKSQFVDYKKRTDSVVETIKKDSLKTSKYLFPKTKTPSDLKTD